MKIIDGKNAILGRLASYAAKEALKGEEITILNCEQIIITGNKKNIRSNFEEKQRRGGSSQKGPFFTKTSERIVKRIIRGMLPDYRKGRGKEAYKRIKCYIGVPKEFENSKKIASGKEKINRFLQLKEIAK
jgi:large subunit ribosomal protein L13